MFSLPPVHLSLLFLSHFLLLSIMSVACSDPEYMPRKMKDTRLPQRVTHERCWCGHLSMFKESVDFSTCMGMKFFMCPNYDASPPRQASSSYERPPSPPPLCKWYHWIDTKQLTWAMQEIRDKSRAVWAAFHEEEHAERRAEQEKKEHERKLKKLREERAQNREINMKRRAEKEEHSYAEEQVCKEACEAERKRLRERACEAQAEEEREDKTEKYPR